MKYGEVSCLSQGSRGAMHRTSDEVVYTCATAWPCFGGHDVNLVWLAAAMELLPSAGECIVQ
jgi:hypothetical protein